MLQHAQTVSVRCGLVVSCECADLTVPDCLTLCVWKMLEMLAKLQSAVSGSTVPLLPQMKDRKGAKAVEINMLRLAIPIVTCK